MKCQGGIGMTRIQLINGRQARMIEATISLPAEELARLLSANITDRHAAMVQAMPAEHTAQQAGHLRP